MIRIVFLLLISICIAFQSNAQDLRSHVHRTIGVNIHTTGWGMNYSHFFSSPKNGLDGINIDYMTQNVFGERKDNRETIANSRLVINKINQMYYLRFGGVKSYEIGTRQTRSNVGVNGIFSAGPLLAIYKPVFIQYSDSDSQALGIKDVRYNPQIHNASQIFGKSAFSNGIGQSKLKVGAYLKTALRFDWGSYESNFKALEVGFNIQYINNPEPLIFSLARQNVQANLYVMLSFGKIVD